MTRILLVEDDRAIDSPLARGLERSGFTVQHVATGAAALAAPPADLVLLDLGLPDVDGTEVCRTLRARSAVPIIIVSARDDEVDRVVGLELGADDYVAKPFSTRELVARIRAVIRRSGSAITPDASADDAPLEAGGVHVDPRSRRVTVRGTEVHLTPKEHDLLVHLLRDPGRVHRRSELLEAVWGGGWDGADRTIDAHVANLRRKLGGVIGTVRGVGYRIEEHA